MVYDIHKPLRHFEWHCQEPNKIETLLNAKGSGAIWFVSERLQQEAVLAALGITFRALDGGSQVSRDAFLFTAPTTQSKP